MKNTKAMIFVLLLVLMSPAALALVWQDPYWLPLGTKDPNAVTFGQTATAASGGFSSIDPSVGYRVELRKADGTLVKVLEDRNIDVSVYTGYETVKLSQADYAVGGDYFVRFTISDSHETKNKQLRLSVSGTNTCPVFDSLAAQTVREGDTLTFTVSASDADADPLTYSASGLPDGASFSASTGVFTWTPGNDDAGVYDIEFLVSDGTCAAVSMTVRVTVTDNAMPSVTLTAMPSEGREGMTTAFVCTAVGGDAPLFYSIDFGDGESIAASTATHKYAVEGSYTAVCTVTDADSDIASDSEVITVADYVPVVDLFAFPESGDAPLDVEFSCLVDGGNSPFIFVYDFGDGNTEVSSEDTVSYAYDAEGMYVASCSVIDADGDMGSDIVSIDVSTSNSCPVFAPLADQSVSVGNALDFALEAVDADGDVLVFSADAPFTAMLKGDGKFSWTPVALQVGTHVATFRVTDGLCEDVMSVDINVRGDGNTAPEAGFDWTPESPDAGETVFFTSTSTDADGDSLSCEWDFDADGLADSLDCDAKWIFTVPG
ncbi:MAG: PKD domain-containing protein, partial [Candidatus Woesearchaeota archaeon]